MFVRVKISSGDVGEIKSDVINGTTNFQWCERVKKKKKRLQNLKCEGKRRFSIRKLVVERSDGVWAKNPYALIAMNHRSRAMKQFKVQNFDEQ